MAVLAATTLLGVFMLAVGRPTGPASFAMCCAAYALAVHGRHAEGAELAGTLRGAGAVLFAAVASGVAAAVAPGGRGRPGAWDSFSLGALIAASWVLGYALRTRRGLRRRRASAPRERSWTNGCASPASCTTSSATRSA
jgi:hypothetical protein